MNLGRLRELMLEVVPPGMEQVHTSIRLYDDSLTLVWDLSVNLSCKIHTVPVSYEGDIKAGIGSARGSLSDWAIMAMRGDI